MNEVTFEWGKLKIQVRAETARDIMDRSSIIGVVLDMALKAGDIAPQNPNLFNRTRAYWFGRMILSSTILKGDIGFPWIDINQASAEEIYASYKGWLDKTPANLWDKWSDAIEEANQEVLDPEE